MRIQKIDVLAVLKIHGENSGYAPAGVIYKPRDDARIAYIAVAELIESVEALLEFGRDTDNNKGHAARERVYAALATVKP